MPYKTQGGPGNTTLAAGIPLVITSRIVSTDETVTVPAGTFTGCVKVLGTGSGKDDGFVTILVNVEVITWFAPGGLGEVKSVIKETDPNTNIQLLKFASQLFSV
jgi:hypothetical protein